MTPDELHELAGLLEKAAVVGPWAARFDPAFLDGWWITDGNSNLGTDIDEHDAALIVAAVNALPSLLSDLREARERIAEIDRAKAKECWPSPDGKHNVRGNICIYCRWGDKPGEGWGGGSGARIKELEER